MEGSDPVRAVARRKYGNPDVLQLLEVERPAPRDDEVLVKVDAPADRCLAALAVFTDR
jgi:D-arabinose 1-dehydrogenase-like Zn-dependent alcohol dehydrogenase